MANFSYDDIIGISKEAFDVKFRNFDPSRYVSSDAVDLAKIERLLDLADGVLSGQTLYLERYACESCGKILAFSDFVRTSLQDAGHPKSFVVHTLLGSKYIDNKHRPVRCGNCDTVSVKPLNYMGNKYKCCNDIPI